ncbi:MAG: hypothetical protein JXA95_14970 [Spirochaetales bacterium]|nr:hypothetical protein [Spirochaetales bacterium]
MKRSCLVVILVLGCILAVGAQGHPTGFSGKAALRGFFMDGEFLPALDISAGFRVGALSGK